MLKLRAAQLAAGSTLFTRVLVAAMQPMGAGERRKGASQRVSLWEGLSAGWGD